MSMTKKDYVLIADAMNLTQPSTAWLNKRQQWASDCSNLANAFALTNPKFDRERFLEACGVNLNTEGK